MHNFKVGDRVERTETPFFRLKVGTQAVVSTLRGNDELELAGYSGAYLAKYFKPVPVVHATRVASPLPTDSAERKQFPLCAGLLDYFPAALAAVSKHSYMGNEKHNPGQALHWSRGKSADHLDALLRHVMERDLEGAAWRALAALQMQLEAEGAPVALGAREP